MATYASVGTFQKMYPSIELDEDEVRQRLKTASRHIDSLTYNRLVGSGKERLTPWQQEVLQEVTCQQAQFEYENEDEINMILSSYSINGVSAQFGSSGMGTYAATVMFVISGHKLKGILVPRGYEGGRENVEFESLLEIDQLMIELFTRCYEGQQVC